MWEEVGRLGEDWTALVLRALVGPGTALSDRARWKTFWKENWRRVRCGGGVGARCGDAESSRLRPQVIDREDAVPL